MNTSRRKLITTGIAAAAGATGLAAAVQQAEKHDLLAPDSTGIWGPGEALTYATQRLLTRHSMAREFRRDQISKVPFVNGPLPKEPAFVAAHASGFADWKLEVRGLVSNPITLTMADLKRYPSRSQITHLACEEGWSYIAEWTGVPLTYILNEAGIRERAKYVVYHSIQKDWWETIDMEDALHPQTLLTYGLNGGDLPVGNGGPLRMRVPRQLGYKSVKYINGITVIDDVNRYTKSLVPAPPDPGYAWYAGI